MPVSFEDGVRYIECDTCHLEIRSNQEMAVTRWGVYHGLPKSCEPKR